MSIEDPRLCLGLFRNTIFQVISIFLKEISSLSLVKIRIL
jgi:hypothetical protein